VKKSADKIWLLVLLVSVICWIGGINVRAIIGFDLLQMGTLDFKPNIHPYVERTVFGLLARSSLLVDCAYIVVWFSGILCLVKCAVRFKENGWLLMSAILFYMFTPVEIYTMVLDFRLWLLDFNGSNDLVEIRKLFIHRLGVLSGRRPSPRIPGR